MVHQGASARIQKTSARKSRQARSSGGETHHRRLKKNYQCRRIVSAEYHELLGGRSNLSNTEWDDFYKMVDWQGDKPKMARTPKNFRKLIKRWHASWRDDNHVVLGRAPSARGWLVGNKVRQRKRGFYGVHLQKVPLVRDLPHSDRDPTTGSICFRCLVPGADLVEGCLSEWGTGRNFDDLFGNGKSSC